MTDDPEIRTASSLMDYIFRRLAADYLSFDDRLELGLASLDDMPDERQTALLTDAQAAVNAQAAVSTSEEPAVASGSQDVSAMSTIPAATDKTSATTADSSAPLCYNCGNQTQRAGSCYVCLSCGSTTGCS
jgi:ribonucleoside-diphosphate reductase alpha chain